MYVATFSTKMSPARKVHVRTFVGDLPRPQGITVDVYDICMDTRV